ncbi:excisionase family DNA-binding protein [Mycobacteroides abscessus]|uniref:excisionase family DNA-binding protein n=1 Tax=Mycobacteroides abscessus TaxID=36809 RepID=UPI0009282352|nr:excisionase family DNA-binding protein [Mycobacteroides abscessus]SIH16566.1 DNA binding domain, excisionase family [Mycobacteroides abscessus subsp. abscessus]
MSAYETDAASHADGFITVLDAAQLLGVTRLTVDNMISSGRLRAVRRGRRWVTTREWVAGAHRGHRPRRRVPAGMLTVNEAAEHAGVHHTTIRMAIKNGRLPAIKPEWPNGYGIDPAVLAVWAPRTRKPNTSAATRNEAAAKWRRANGFLSVAEAAAQLGITRQAMQVRITRGQQEAVRAGADAPTPGAWLIREADVPERAA